MLHSVKNITGTLTAGLNPHTIGDGGDIDLDRPIKIESVFVRKQNQSDPVDYHLAQVDNIGYQDFIQKSSSITYPNSFYYEPSYPLGKIYVYPVNDSDLEIHLSVWLQLPKFESLVTETDMPAICENTLKYQLATDLAPSLGKSASVMRGTLIYDRLTEFMRQIKSVNQQRYETIVDSALLCNNYDFNIYRGY
jgi:hypothetical protein